MRVLYPGSFDPMHLGHVDIIAQASSLFGNVVVAILHNPEKHGGVFTIEQRIHLINGSLREHGVDGVEVRAFPGLAIDAAKAVDANFIVKGLRNAGDFEIEQQMAHTNLAVGGVPTVYLPCDPALASISSRFVREIAQYGGDPSPLVPVNVALALKELFS